MHTSGWTSDNLRRTSVCEAKAERYPGPARLFCIPHPQIRVLARLWGPTSSIGFITARR